MKTKNQLILFSTLHPDFYKKNQYYISENEYLVSLKHLLKLYPESNFILLDNSIDHISEIESLELKSLLFQQVDNYPIFKIFFDFKKITYSNSSIAYINFILNSESFVKNSTSHYFTFFSLRRIITSTCYFEKLEILFKNNYDCIFINNGRYENPNLENNNLVTDCLFTMNQNSILNYIDFLKRIDLKNTNDSEYYLNMFISSTNIKYEVLKNVGLIENINYRDFFNINLILY